MIGPSSPLDEELDELRSRSDAEDHKRLVTPFPVLDETYHTCPDGIRWSSEEPSPLRESGQFSPGSQERKYLFELGIMEAGCRDLGTGISSRPELKVC